MNDKSVRPINVYVPETIVKIKYDRLTFFDSLACVAMALGFISFGIFISQVVNK